MTDSVPKPTVDAPYRNPVPADRPAPDMISVERLAMESGSDESLRLRDYWRVCVKRRWTILISLIITVSIAATATFLMTPLYRATVVLQIDREAPRVVKFEDVAPVETLVSDQQFYQTQYALLKSRSLALRVVQQLNLGQYRVYERDQGQGLWTAWFGGGRRGKDEPGDVVSDKQALIGAFLDHLTVEPIRNSKLVKLHYDLPDPELAARITNGLARAFIDLNLERRFDATSYAKKFLQERLAQVKARLEDSEGKLVAFTRSEGVVQVDEKQTLASQKLKAVSEALAEAEKERIGAESVYREAREAQGHGLTRILDNQAINQLKQSQTELEGQYQERLGIFKPNYPGMKQLRKRIDQIQAQMDREMGFIHAAVRSDYEAATRKQEMLVAELAAIKTEVLRLEDLGSQHNILTREVDANRIVYEGLLQRLKEVGVAGGVDLNNISITDAAEVPDKRYKPEVWVNLFLGFVLGLLGGLGMAFLFEHLDDTIKLPEDLERVGPLPVLGIIPESPKKAEGEATLAAIVYHDPRSAIAEAFRSMRTALLLATPLGAPKVLQLTSAGQDEGKTTAALNLAITFTQMGHKVLLIDCDLRSPSLHRLVEVDPGFGLTHYLTGAAEPAQVAQYANVPNLFVIPAGPMPPNPVELLSSARMSDLLTLAVKKYGYVILDGPPSLGLADALVLASMAHGTMIVVDSAVTRRDQLIGALKRLRAARATIIGGVLNKLSQRESGYSYYQHYYHHPNGQSIAKPGQSIPVAHGSVLKPPAPLCWSSNTLPDPLSQEPVESPAPPLKAHRLARSPTSRKRRRTVSKRATVTSTNKATSES